MSLSACQGSRPAAKTREARPGPSGGPTETVAATTYTADRLKRALVTKVTGYRATGAPIAGKYGELKPVQDFKRAQSRLRVSPAHCADAARGALAAPAISGAPSAVVSMVGKGGQSFTEALLAASPSTARYLVDFEIPAPCRTFQARADGQSTTNKVVVSEAGRLGEGSRVTGMAMRAGSARSRTWSVSIRSAGYVLTTTLIGPKATRAEAERLARHSLRRARQSLR